MIMPAHIEITHRHQRAANKPYRLFSVLAFCAIALVGCSSTSVKVYQDESSDITTLASYIIVTADGSNSNEPTLNNTQTKADQELEIRIREAALKQVAATLASKGYRAESEPSQADFIVRFQHSIVEKSEIERTHSGIGLRRPVGESEMVVQTSDSKYFEESWVIDTYSSGSNTLLWRGTARQRLPVNENRDQHLLRSKSAISQIMQKLPAYAPATETP